MCRRVEWPLVAWRPPCYRSAAGAAKFEKNSRVRLRGARAVLPYTRHYSYTTPSERTPAPCRATETSETGKIRIEIEPVWRFHRDDQSMLVMLDFLNEIRSTGKITRAAQRAGHVIPALLEPDREMGRVLRHSAGRSGAGPRHAAHPARRETGVGGPAIAGAAASAAAKSRAGARGRDQRGLAATEQSGPFPCESWICDLEAARIAGPRAPGWPSTCAT